MKRSAKILREMQIDQFLDADGVLYLWNQIKQEFLPRDEYVAGGGEADSVAWENITNKPTDLVHTSDMEDAIDEAVETLTTSLTSISERMENAEQGLSQRPTTEQVDQKISAAVVGVYRFMGSVPAYVNLPTSGMTNGDVYDVEDTGMNYAWVVPEDGSQGYWDPLGQIFQIQKIPNSVIQQIVDGTYGSEA